MSIISRHTYGAVSTNDDNDRQPNMEEHDVDRQNPTQMVLSPLSVRESGNVGGPPVTAPVSSRPVSMDSDISTADSNFAIPIVPEDEREGTQEPTNTHASQDDQAEEHSKPTIGWKTTTLLIGFYLTGELS